jgi:CRISPR/Cas system Type II protein with McrA/HNH and RuvC-like nuclease domain
MKIIKILKFIYDAEHPHFLSVDKKVYVRWSFIIRLFIKLNKNYKPCEIFRKKYKSMEDLVVIGLKFNGKNVKRRTSGFAKEFLEENKHIKCIYCDTNLDRENATADHIIPISKGGNNTQVNLVVCCKDCNNERGNLDFNEYLALKNKKYRKLKNKFI